MVNKKLKQIGMQKEFSNWLKDIRSEKTSVKIINLTSREQKLYNRIREGYTRGEYIRAYVSYGFTADEIKDLHRKGLIHLENSSFDNDDKIPCPKGHSYHGRY